MKQQEFGQHVTDAAQGIRLSSIGHAVDFDQ